MNTLLSKGSAPYYITGLSRQKKKKGLNERTDQSSRKIQLIDKEIANLSDAQFKTLVIRMLTELVEYDCKLKEKMKAMKSEIKEMYREPTVKGRKLGLKSMVWSRRKK